MISCRSAINVCCSASQRDAMTVGGGFSPIGANIRMLTRRGNERHGL
jgi:hypothetical protein